MNEQFNKAFADIFGTSSLKPTVGFKTASRSSMFVTYPECKLGSPPTTPVKCRHNGQA